LINIVIMTTASINYHRRHIYQNHNHNYHHNYYFHRLCYPFKRR
jgi:hypothetical protein